MIRGSGYHPGLARDRVSSVALVPTGARARAPARGPGIIYLVLRACTMETAYLELSELRCRPEDARSRTWTLPRVGIGGTDDWNFY